MSAKTILGVALTLAAVSLAGGGVYAVHTLKQKKYDVATLCPLEGSRAAVVIIADKTDPLTPAEQEAARNLIAAEASSVRRGGRISVRILQQKEGGGSTVLDTAADLCNPGMEANPLFENPKRVAARYENAFQAPIHEALASIQTAGSAAASPIAASIRESLTALPERPQQHIKLVLISDLMEHTAEASAYSGTLNAAALSAAIPRAAQERLRDAEIKILLLDRPAQAKQQAAALAVWRAFFQTLTKHDIELQR